MQRQLFLLRPATGAGRWLPVTVTAVVWLLLGVSAAYWGLQVFGRGSVELVPMLQEASPTLDKALVARALGAGVSGEVPSDGGAVSTRHVLVGVATDAAGQGVALISTDSQPAKAYRVGARLPDGLVVYFLARREAQLALEPGAPASVRLELPVKSSGG